MTVETQVEIAQAALAGLFGGNEPAIPASPLLIVTEELPPLDTFLLASEEHHPVLVEIDSKLDLAAAGVAVGKRSPQARSLFIRSETAKPRRPYPARSRLGRRRRRARGALRTLQSLHQLAAAKLQVRRVELLKDDIRDNLRILVEKSYCEADLARRVLTVEVRFGRTVLQGDLLFTLSSSEVDAKLTQAEVARDAASAMQPKSNAGARRQEVRAACIV